MSLLERMLEAWDREKLPIQLGTKKKCAYQLCKEWASLKDEEGRLIWTEHGTFEYRILKTLRPRLKPSQIPYWYCWAELSYPAQPQSYDNHGSQSKTDTIQYWWQCRSLDYALLAIEVCSRVETRTEYVLTHIPFSPSDLVIWKKDTSSFQSDSQTIIRTIQLIISSHNPLWSDMIQLLHIFLTNDEILSCLKDWEDCQANHYYNTRASSPSESCLATKPTQQEL